jgi:hypothetical protein
LATDSEDGGSSDNEEAEEEDDSESDDDGQRRDLPLRKKGSGGDDENAEALRERYRRLLLGGGIDSSSVGKDNKRSEKERKGRKDWVNADGNDDDDDVTRSERSSDEEKKAGHGASRKQDMKMEMEVTFTSGLESLGERLIAKRKEAEIKAGETVWDAYLRRKKEKKAAAKKLGIVNIDSDDDDYDEEYSTKSDESGSEHEEKGRGERKQPQHNRGKKSVGDNKNNGTDQSDDELPSGVADDPFFQDDDDPFNDPFFQDGPHTAAGAAGTTKSGKEGGRKKTNKKGRRAADDDDDDDDNEEVRKQKAELEMLLLDESALFHKGIAENMPTTTRNGDSTTPVKVSKKERIRLKKESKRRERAMGSDDEDHQEAAGAGFKMNLEDPRFKELLVAPDFALDPTDPRFTKAGPGASLIAKEVAKRRSKINVSTIPRNDEYHPEGEKGGEMAPPTKGGNTTSAADLKLMVASLKRKAAVIAMGNDEESRKGRKMATKRT